MRRARQVAKIILQVSLGLAAIQLVPIACRVATVYRFDLDTCRVAIGGAAASSPGSLRPLKVLSYNVMGRGALFDGDHVERIAAVISLLEPDLVGLQEVHVGTWQARFEDQLSQIARLTGMVARFGGSFTELGGSYGNAVLTRGRFVDSTVVPLPSLGEPRSLLRTTVDLDGLVLDFYVTHLAPWGDLAKSVRARQAECVAANVRSSPRPVILAADFNAPPDAVELVPLLVCDVLVSEGPGVPATYPLTGDKLDYVLSAPVFEPARVEVRHVGPSDHHPLLVHLQPSQRAAVR